MLRKSIVPDDLLVTQHGLQLRVVQVELSSTRDDKHAVLVIAVHESGSDTIERGDKITLKRHGSSKANKTRLIVDDVRPASTKTNQHAVGVVIR